MRVDRTVVYRYRAVFGLGFVVLGGVTLWRVVVAPAPANNKILGVLLAVVMIGLGAARLAQYARYRQSGGS